MKTNNRLADNRLAFARPWMATLLFAGACATEPSPQEPEPESDAGVATATLTATSVRPTANATLVTKPLPPPLPLPPPPPDPVAPTVLALERGTGWKRVQVSGTAEDLETGTMQTLGSEFYVIDGRASINNTALPANTRAVLTGQLATMPMPADGDDEIIIVPKGLNDAIQSNVEVLAFCDDSTKVFGKTLNFDRAYNYHRGSEPGALVGSGDFHTRLQGTITGEVRYSVRYHWCWPTFVFHRLTVRGDANLVADATLVAQFQKQWSWHTKVAEPTLGTVSLYGIPITFTAPITVGLDAQAAATLNFNGSYQAHGQFDIHCTGNGCDGSKDATSSFTPGGSPTISVDGKVKVIPWAEGAVRATLIDSDIAYAQVGVRAKLTGELWGYAGNTCGDGDHDGVNEFVTAATLDLGVGIDVVARAGILGNGLGPWSWNVWQQHLAFWGTGDALAPIFYGKSCGGHNTANMKVAMRPCWPYNDAISYKMTWGDGSTNTFTGHPDTLLTQTHNYASYGLKTIRVDAVEDSKGRDMASAVTRSINVSWLPIVCLDDLVLTQ